MSWRVEHWTSRGIKFHEAASKREANRLAEALRSEPGTAQTAVHSPNGRIRFCAVRGGAR